MKSFDAAPLKEKHFIAALKDNRLVALSETEKKQGHYQRIDRVSLPEKQAVRGWLKGYAKEVLLVRHVFTNKDGSTGILNLVCSDLTLDGEQVTAIYQNDGTSKCFINRSNPMPAWRDHPCRR